MNGQAPANDAAAVDAYIASYPAEVQEVLRAVRAVVARAVPGLTEHISYGMPTVMLGRRRVVYYAAWKKHLALYPIPAFEDELEAEVARYRAAKGAVNFPYKAGVPLDLVERIVRQLREAPGSD